jgi:hypothetical protein
MPMQTRGAHLPGTRARRDHFLFRNSEDTFMRRFIAATSVILLELSSPAFSQSSGDMDSSGRFGGMPPGTDRYRQDNDQGGVSIPLAPVETDRITVDQPSAPACPRPGTREWRAEERDGTLPDDCR